MICEKCLGKVNNKKAITATNFCVPCKRLSIIYRCATNAPYFVYKLVDKRGQCLYVGATAQPATRFTAHAKKKRFWKMVLLKGFQEWEDALKYEGELIKQLRPKLNRYELSEATLRGLSLRTKSSDESEVTTNKFILGENSGTIHTPKVHGVTYCNPCNYSFRYELYDFTFTKG
jgi:predicted GIY-YIG superfamily endonuclease